MSNKCCDMCTFYEPRTGFCRSNPPTPVTIAVKDKKSGEMKDYVVSKYPVISFSDTDWCGDFKDKKVLLLS